MQAAALIMAAGSGSRAGAAAPKQFLPFDGATMLRRSVEAVQAHPAVSNVVAVIDPAHMALAQAALEGLTGVRLVSGGATRTQSVAAGLEALAAEAPQAVLIHDAARPGLPDVVIDALLAALASGVDGAAPALPVTDALKLCDDEGRILEDRPRDGLMRVQTPQAFLFVPILAAYRAHSGQAQADDLAVAAAAGLALRVVPGAHSLMKATFKEDFAVMEALSRGPARIGTGFDVHRFGPGDHVTLCGVRIPMDRGLIGHSDADVAWHALTDALLGAVAAGDIGDHFPPSDPQWRGADSAVFLRHAADLVARQGGVIVNVDVTVIGEKPKVKPHRAAMREATAALLGLSLTAVSVKATTTEQLGFTGREEGLAAQAAVSVSLPL